MNQRTRKAHHYLRNLACLFIALVFSLPLYADRLVFTDEEQQWLDAHPVLRVPNLRTFPPFNFNEDGTPKGYTIDYLSLMARLAGTRIAFITDKSWHQHLSMLKNGELDVIPHIAITEERAEFIDFTPFNHVEYTSGVAINRDAKIESIDDLNGKVVAVVKKSFLHGYMTNNYSTVSLLLVASTRDATSAVAAGKADVAISNLPTLNYYIQKDWLTNLHITQIAGFNLPSKVTLPMGVVKGNDVLSSILVKTNRAISYAQRSALKQKWMSLGATSGSSERLTETEQQYLNSKAQLKVCIDPDWMPLESLQDGKHTGVAADFVAGFQQTLGVPIQVVKTASWSESLQAGRRGECDFFSLIMNSPERARYLSFTKPYIQTPLVFATRFEELYVSNISALKGKTIGIVKGYASKDILAKNFPDLVFVDVENIADGLKKVSKGDLFGYADSLISIGYWLQNHYNGKLKVSGEFDESWKLGIGVNRNDPVLKGIFDKVVNQLTADEQRKVVSKWIAINYQTGINWYITLLSVVCVIIFFGIPLFWYRKINNRLRVEVDRRTVAEAFALRLAKTDPLTGLLNRFGSENLLDQEMASCRNSGRRTCMMIMDIDHFKSVNDQYGHRVGDEVLKMLADSLNIMTPQGDRVIRWGGEEFLVLVPNTGVDQAMQLAEQLRQTVENITRSDLPRFTVSIGVAEFRSEQAFSQWYEEADKALYEAKETGRNRVVAEHTQARSSAPALI